MFSVVASHYTLTQNELPLFPELLLLSFLKFINPKLKYCNLKQATFAYFCLFFCILLQNQAKISKSCLLQIAIFQLWVDEFSKSQKQSFREGWELILSWRWVNFLNTQFFYKGKMSNLGVKSILEWRSLYILLLFPYLPVSVPHLGFKTNFPVLFFVGSIHLLFSLDPRN